MKPKYLMEPRDIGRNSHHYSFRHIVTPMVESQSSTSTEVAVVANVNYIAFSVVCTEKKLIRKDRNVVVDACPTPVHFARQKTQDGSLFAAILAHTREAFVQLASKKRNYLERYGIPVSALQCAPILMFADSPSFHKSGNVQEAARTLI